MQGNFTYVYTTCVQNTQDATLRLNNFEESRPPEGRPKILVYIYTYMIPYIYKHNYGILAFGALLTAYHKPGVFFFVFFGGGVLERPFLTF